jgi:hypothetical protein
VILLSSAVYRSKQFAICWNIFDTNYTFYRI